MDQDLLDNVQRYQALVGRFKPPVEKEPVGQLSMNPNLVVATRIRPLLEQKTESGQIPGVFPRPGQDGVVDIHEMRKVVQGLPTLNSFCFRSDRTFHPHQSTQVIHDEIVKPLVPWVLKGRVGTLFVSGHTGSGRNYTVRGLETLIACSLFEAVQPKQQIHISVVELAGNSAYDLLNNCAPFRILEDASGQVHLEGVVEDDVSSPEKLLQSIDKASSTAKKNGPSRSHSICRIKIYDNSSAGPGGSLYMINLASSEAEWDAADPTTDRVKESREIGMSLSTLKDCIRSMAQINLSSAPVHKGKQPHIPFRQSALTKVLKHLFEPESSTNCKTVFLTCINPSFLDVEASKSSLRYAEMLRVVLPQTKAGDYDPAVPSTWSNKEVKNYIKLQSGYFPVTPYDLAPTESGAELLHLPIEEFVRRCLLAPDVTEEQAKAFHAKLWALHVRSRRKSNAETQPKVDLPEDKGSASREPDGEKAKLPFKERIRPGMAISWAAPWDVLSPSPRQNLAVVLSPQEDGNCSCALVLPGAVANAFEVHLWKQVVVNVGDMVEEVVLEYDSATRYYRIAEKQ
ncbi:P-loop containing nucleoside triphosphate hydrolase protein [Aspergillus oleicola]